MGSNQRNASDAELPGPGSSVTDLSVSQGTTVDDLDRIECANTETIRISVPLDVGGTLCPPCLQEGRNILCLNLRDLTNHLSAHHLLVNVLWICSQCERSFLKPHGWRCHFTKCKGVPEPRENMEFQCALCKEAFESQIGLSMHERHKHPALRNRKRMDQAEQPRKPKGRKATVWTSEEVARLIELDARFRNTRFPNIEIHKHLSSKTAHQIRSKRKDLPRPISPRSSSSSESEDEAIDEAANEEEIQIIDCSEEQVEIGDDGEELWLESMRNVIETEVQIPGNLKTTYEHLMSIWINNKDNLKELCTEIENFITCVLCPILLSDKAKANNAKSKVKSRVTRGGNKKRRNAKRKYEFARTQELYRHCPKKLANMILKNDLSMVNPPHPLPADQAIKDLYGQLWGTTGPIIQCFGGEQIEAPVMMSSIPPLSIIEVEKRIRKIKTKSAAGPDGIRRSDLNKNGIPSILSKIYNILLYANYYPNCWKINRTTLIPKAHKDLNDIKNWRPITIGSLMSRIFSSLIDSRLRAIVENHVRQKGFTSENGCAQNTILLAEAIQRCKSHKGGVFSILDINKAFDTVPHSAIKAALLRKRVPARMCEYICAMYENCSTLIRTNESQPINVQIRRGVKQGDPLSPLLFNLCIDKLIGDIEASTAGLAVSTNRSVSVLAFADDLVLLSENKSEAQDQLCRTSAYLDTLEMSLSASKCGAFHIKTTKDTWYIKDPEIDIKEERIPNIDPEEMFSYLGAKFGPWKGLHRGLVVPDIIGTLKRTRALALKPHQKLDLFLTFILPHFIYSLLISPPSESTLKLLDSDIRQEIKEILHLVPSTARAFFYVSKNSGGLGVPRLEYVVKLATLRNGIKMLASEDQAIREVLQHDNAENKFRKIASSLRINWPATLDDIDSAKKRLKAEDLKNWSDLRSQGQGVSDYRNDRVGNYWLVNPSVLKASRYIDALRLRTNTYGTRVVLARAKKGIDIKCRRCHVQPETIGHVLGLCVHTKKLRIKRHDEVKNFLVSKLAPATQVAVEATVNVNGNLYKPDLIVKSENKAFIVDVTVRYEHRDYLQKASKEKIDKYSPCLGEVKRRFGCNMGEVIPIVIGSRGVMPQSTIANLKTLGINKKDAITIALNVLRSSIEIANIFIDYDK